MNRPHSILPKLVLLAASLVPMPALAQLVVTSADDSGAGTLRDAIDSAVGGETITFDAGLSGATITLTSQLVVDVSLIIAGPGSDQLTISGGNTTRVFLIEGAAASFELCGVTVANAMAGEGGGAIRNTSATDVDLVDVHFSSNVATCLMMNCDASGGVFDNRTSSATIIVDSSVFQGNRSMCTGDGCDAAGACFDNGASGFDLSEWTVP